MLTLHCYAVTSALHSRCLMPHPLGCLSLFASREKHSAGSWTTTLLQLGQSCSPFLGVSKRPPLSPSPPPLPPPPPPPPPPLKSATRSLEFCAMTSVNCFHCSASSVYRIVRRSLAGETGVHSAASMAQYLCENAQYFWFLSLVFKLL
jgi:hypothetical protein